MKRLLSLFDYSGAWSAPYWEAGWDVITWDIKHGLDVHEFNTFEKSLEILEDIDGILAAPPCTDFTSAGAQYWAQKDKDGRTQASLAMVNRVLQLAGSFEPTCLDYLEECGDTFFWVIENPVGRLGKLIDYLGAPKYFQPCDYAGYLDLTDSDHNELDRLRRKDGDLTWEEIYLVMEKNAYNKKTGLWGKFQMPEPKKVEPVKCSRQGSWTQKLGGSGGARTQELRSMTPAGFARAFYQANMALTYDELSMLNQ